MSVTDVPADRRAYLGTFDIGTFKVVFGAICALTATWLLQRVALQNSTKILSNSELDWLTRVDTYIGLFCFHTLVMDIEREYKRAPFLRLHISHARCVLRFFALWFLIAEAFPRSLNSLSSGDDMVWQRTETRGKAQRIWLNIPVLHIYIPGTWNPANISFARHIGGNLSSSPTFITFFWQDARARRRHAYVQWYLPS